MALNPFLVLENIYNSIFRFWLILQLVLKNRESVEVEWNGLLIEVHRKTYKPRNSSLRLANIIKQTLTLPDETNQKVPLKASETPKSAKNISDENLQYLRIRFIPWEGARRWSNPLSKESREKHRNVMKNLKQKIPMHVFHDVKGIHKCQKVWF